MKKLLLFVLPLLVAFFGLRQSLAAQDVNNFSISDFSATYSLSKNDYDVGQLEISERITAVFPNYNQNHGIERAIPKTYKNNSLELKITSVTKDNGQPWNFSTRTQNDNLVLRIGDADKYVQGEQTYIIKYSVSNVITFYDNYDELSWDVNGDGWLQTFQNVEATVTGDQQIFNLSSEVKCYTGSFGSHESNCTAEQYSGVAGPIYEFQTNKPLGPNQTMSIQMQFQKGTFQPAPTNWVKLIATYILISMPLTIPLIATVVLIGKWRKTGRDPKGKGVIVPQYTPLKGVNPLVSDVIISEKMRPVSIGAVILDLSIKGFLKIYETEKKGFIIKKPEYEIELTKDPETLDAEEQKVISMLFANVKIGEKINISQQKNKLHTQVKNLSNMAESSAVKKGYFLVAPTKSKQSYIIVAVILFVAVFVLGFIFAKVNFDIFSGLSPFMFVAIGLVITSVEMMFFANIMPKKTVRGVHAKEYLQGLEDYMKLAESDRIKTLQSPSGAEKSPINTDNKQQLIKLYEKLLPYAVLFGIEKEWAEQIAPLYTQPPSWYSGSQTFNSAIFVSAVSNLNSATTNSFSAPSSSGSGGGAGGGGGGGGGGGW